MHTVFFLENRLLNIHQYSTRTGGIREHFEEKRDRVEVREMYKVQ